MRISREETVLTGAEVKVIGYILIGIALAIYGGWRARAKEEGRDLGLAHQDMWDVAKGAFGAEKSQEEKTLELIESVSAPQVAEGKVMAKDIFKDHLVQGRAIPYSAIVQTVERIHAANSGPVLHGCLKQLQRYMAKGKVLALSGGAEGDTVFVHKDHAPDQAGPDEYWNL